MRLDDHRIVIRQRSYAELLDLSLHVLRDQAGPLAVALLAGIGPLVLLNAWLLNRFAAVPSGAGPPWTFLLLMLALVFFGSALGHRAGDALPGPGPLQPAAGAKADRPRLRPIARPVGPLPGLLARPVAGHRGGRLCALCRQSLLEWNHPSRNEIHSPTERQSLSTARRSSRLHQGNGGDFFLRWLLNTLIGPILILAIWAALATAARWLLADRVWSQPFYTCLYPVACGRWLLTTPSCVFWPTSTSASAAKVGKWNC